MDLNYQKWKKLQEELKYTDKNVRVVNDGSGRVRKIELPVSYSTKPEPTFKTTTSKKKDDDEKKWYEGILQLPEVYKNDFDLLDDGYDFGDGIRTVGRLTSSTIGTILGTTADATLGVVKGVASVGEDIAALGSGLVAQGADWLGADEYADKVRKRISEGKHHVISGILEKGQNAIDDFSIIGDTGDKVTEGVGQLGAYAVTGGAGMFTSGAGGSLEESYQKEGVEDWQVWTKAVGTGAISWITERMGGFLAKGTPIDEIAANKISQQISNGMLKVFTRSTLSATAEAGEEALEYAGNYLLNHGIDKVNEITGGKGAEFKEDWDWEAFGEQMAIGFLTSKAASTGMTVSNVASTKVNNKISTKEAINEVAKQQDHQAGMLTKSEQQAVDSIVNERVDEIKKRNTLENELEKAIKSREKAQGGILSEKNKTALRKSILDKIESGEIDTSNTKINKKELAKVQEEVKKNLSEGNYDLSKLEDVLTPTETAQIKELEQALANTSDNAEKAEIRAKIKELKTTKLNSLRSMVNNNQYLNKAVYETEMSNQQYAYDESEVTDEYEKGTKESAKSYLNNNTTSRNFVENMAKLAKDRQTNYKFTNNQELLEQGDLVEKTKLTTEEKKLIQKLEKELEAATTEAQKKNVQRQIDEIKYLDIGGFVRKNVDGVETVLINVDSKQSLNAVVGHETKHLLEKNKKLNDDYNKLLFEYAKTKGDYDTYKERIERLYDGIDNANLESELSAALTGDYLFTDSQFIETLLNDTNPNTPKIIQKIKELIDDLVVRFKGTKEERQLREVQKKFKELYKQKAEVQSETQGDTETQYGLMDMFKKSKDNVKEQLKYLKTLDKDNDFFYNRGKMGEIGYGNERRIRQAHDGTFDGTTTTDEGRRDNGRGSDSSIGTSSRRELSRIDRLRQEQLRNNERLSNTYEINGDKTSATISNEKIHEIATKNRKNNAKSFIAVMNPNDFLKLTTNSDVLLSLEEQMYKNGRSYLEAEDFVQADPLTLTYDAKTGKISTHEGRHRSIALRNSGITKVDVVINAINGDIDSSNIIAESQYSNRKVKINNLQDVSKIADTNDVSFSMSEKTTTKYSLSDAGTHGTLMAMHSLNEANLKNIIGLGGIPVASIAITNSDNVSVLSEFGGTEDFVLLFDKETINPKNKLNEVYNRDVYSKTIPTIYQKVDKRALNKVLDEFRPYESEYGSFNKHDYSKSSLESIVDDLSYSKAAQAKFLEDNGYEIEKVYKEWKSRNWELSPETLEEFNNKHPELKEISYYDIPSDEIVSRYGKDVKEAIIKDWQRKNVPQNVIDMMFSDKEMSFKDVDQFFSDRNNFNHSYNGEQELDSYATRDNIDKAVKEHQDEFIQWLTSKFENLYGDKYFENETGTRKYDYTLENLTSYMKKGNTKAQQKGMFDTFGIGQAKAGAAVQYKTLEQIKEASKNLVDEETYKARHEAFEGLDESVRAELGETRILKGEDVFEVYSDYYMALSKAASGTNPIKALENNYFTDLTPEQINKFSEVAKALANLPAKYFEAKPQRSIYLNEIETIVAPNTISESFKEQLINNGFKVVEYDPSIEGDKIRIVNQLDDLKFSLSSQNEDIAPVGNYNVYGKDIKYYDLPFDDSTSIYSESLEGMEKALNNTLPEPTEEETQDKPTSAREWKEKATKRTIEQKVEDTIRKQSYKNAASTSMLGRRILNFNEQERRTFRDSLLGLTTKTKEQLINVDAYNSVRDIINQYANREFNYIDEDLAAAKREVRKYRIKLNDYLKKQITDYNDFRKGNFGNLTFSKDGQAIDTIWQELNEQYPYYFSKDVVAEADMIYALSEFMQKDVTITEKYKLSYDDIEGFTKKVYNKIVENSLSQQDLESLEQDLSDQVERRTREVVNNELIDEMGITKEIIDSGKKINQFDLQRTDPIRVNEKIFGWKNGQIVNDATINHTIENEARLIRFKNNERDDIRALGIKPRSKESAAVQKYGEKEYVNDNGEVVPYGDKELASEFSDEATQEKIKRAAQVLREKYDTYLEMVNNVLERMGYDPIPKRKNYMRHFQEMTDIFSKLGTPLNPTSLNENNLPTDINGLTDEFKPGKSWFANAQQRKGMKTVYDAITGIDGYLDSVSNVIFHTEDIQRYRALSKFIRTTYSDKALQDYDLLRDEEKIEALDRAFKGQNGHLAQYVAWLDEQANALAGKKGKIDRGIEEIFGRKVYSVLNDAKKQVGSNMTGFNVRSAMTNFASAVNGMSKTKKAAFLKGTISTFQNIAHDDGLKNKSNFLTTRYGSEQLSKKMWQKVSNYGQIFMNGTDHFTANLIWRSKYFENLDSGMSEDAAIKSADDFAARIMGNRAKGTTAAVFNSKTFGLFTQFQLEVNNQWSSMIHDSQMEIEKGQLEGKTGKAVASVVFNLGQLAVFSNVFNALMKSLTGSDVMFDPIELLKDIIGGDDEEEDITTRIRKAMGEVVDDIPFIGTFTSGRIPIAEAFEGPLTFYKQWTGQTDEYGNEYTDEDVWKALLDSGMYWILPTGYGQIKKTVKGLGMYDEDLPVAGSYTDGGNLRFTADKDLAGKIKAGLFGQYSSSEAQAYIDSGYQTIHKNSVQELVDLDMTSSEYRKYRKGLTAAKKTKDENGYIKYVDDNNNVYWYDKENKTLYNSDYEISNVSVTSLEKASSTAQAFEYITNLNVSDEQKEIMFNNVVDISNTDQYGNVKYTNKELNRQGKEVTKTYWYDEDNDVLYNSDYEEVDSSKVATMTRAADKVELDNYRDFDSYEEFDFAFKNPEEYKVAKTITDDFAEYKRFINDINDIEADKKANGTTVSGSRKKKIVSYVNSLDLTIPQKAILIRQVYSSFNDYNRQIIEYINSLDIEYEEKMSILKSLNMKVSSSGYVSW